MLFSWLGLLKKDAVLLLSARCAQEALAEAPASLQPSMNTCRDTRKQNVPSSEGPAHSSSAPHPTTPNAVRSGSC